MGLGERIRTRRRDLSLSQDSLAKAAGVNQTTLSRWERGEVPIAESLRAIADTLDVSIDWLLTGEGDGPPDLALDDSGEHPLDSDGQTGTDGR
jgi:transcriptional regulator with XRE-family HTH domain